MESGKQGRDGRTPTSQTHMGGAFRFERLEIWHRSVAFADDVYDATKEFPPREQFGLTSQMRRAALSISSNIAEGSSRASSKDFSRFVEIAFGSLCEIVSQMYVAKSQGFLGDSAHAQLYHKAEELSKMLSAFRNSLGKWRSE